MTTTTVFVLAISILLLITVLIRLFYSQAETFVNYVPSTNSVIAENQQALYSKPLLQVPANCQAPSVTCKDSTTQYNVACGCPAAYKGVQEDTTYGRIYCGTNEAGAVYKDYTIKQQPLQCKQLYDCNKLQDGLTTYTRITGLKLNEAMNECNAINAAL
jgi:hypothetical protein